MNWPCHWPKMAKQPTTALPKLADQKSIGQIVGGSFSARVPRSSAELHRGLVHHILEDEVDGQKEEQGDQREDEEGEEVNGDVESARETHNAHMTHADEAWMSADSNLSQCSVMSSEQGKQSRDADNRTKHTNDKGASMHDAFMPIGIRTTLTDSQVFQVTSHIVGLVVLRVEIPIHLLSKHQPYSLLTCTRIP